MDRENLKSLRIAGILLSVGTILFVIGVNLEAVGAVGTSALLLFIGLLMLMKGRLFQVVKEVVAGLKRGSKPPELSDFTIWGLLMVGGGIAGIIAVLTVWFDDGVGLLVTVMSLTTCCGLPILAIGLISLRVHHGRAIGKFVRKLKPKKSRSRGSTSSAAPVVKKDPRTQRTSPAPRSDPVKAPAPSPKPSPAPKSTPATVRPVRDPRDLQAVVVDAGSHMIKAGDADSMAPRSVFPSLVVSFDGEVAVGDRAQIVRREKTGQEGYSYDPPVMKGMVRNWDSLRAVFQEVFSDLGVEASDAAVLVSETPLTPKLDREKVVEMLFEDLDVGAVYLANSAVLSLHGGSKETTGVVLEIGHNRTHVVPIYEGYALPDAVSEVEAGAGMYTSVLMYFLREAGFDFIGDLETDLVWQVCRDIMEKLCYIVEDVEDATSKAETSDEFEKNYELPSGEQVSIGKELFLAPDRIFSPYQEDRPGIHTMIYNSVMKCDEDIRSQLLTNIVLSGGGTMVQGLTERLEKELRDLFPDAEDLKIVAPPERKYLCWIGGSVLATSEGFDENWITREEFDEHGAGIVHRKCP